MTEDASVSLSRIQFHVQSIVETADTSVSEVYLFGSQARGDAREDSDIDIAIIDSKFKGTPMHERGRWFKREWDYVEVGPLELLCLTPTEYDSRLENNHETVGNIEQEGVSLL